MAADTLAERIKKFLNNRGVKICLCILFFFFRSIRTTNNTSFLTFTQTHIPLNSVRIILKKKERDIERETFPLFLFSFRWNIPSKQVGFQPSHRCAHLVERMPLLTCCMETLTWPTIVPMVKAPE